jgi:hypothetical protein
MRILALFPRLTSRRDVQSSLALERLANSRRKFFKLVVGGAAGLAALLELKGRAAAGAGQCSRCRCPSYVTAPYTDLCQRCGHSYSDHW